MKSLHPQKSQTQTDALRRTAQPLRPTIGPESKLANLQAAANAGPAVQRLQMLQRKLNPSPPPPVQRMDDEDLLQGKAIPAQESGGGLPAPLRAGIENLSGLSMDGVQVHRNSAAPAQVGAHAYAQGRDIHLGPGQEQHLAHEAWHVVQQAQGRVRPTMQAMGVAINDDAGLEREADRMGQQAAGGALQRRAGLEQLTPVSSPALQRMVGFEIEAVGMILSAKHDRMLTKGETVDSGPGWKLTPDNNNQGNWTPEYIVAAVDETADDDTLVDPVRAVQAHAQDQLISPDRWSHGDDLEMYRALSDAPLGNFHVTGGVRLSRIGQLISILSLQSAERLDELPPEVARADGESGSNYDSVVALIARQITDLASAGEERNGQSAKQAVSILSRVDLHDVVVKARSIFKFKGGFIADVLRAAGVGANDQLIRHTLPGSGTSNRSIDDQQNITVGEWLNRIFDRTDYLWSETLNDTGQNFGFEPVGPAGPLGWRAEGVVLELRAVQEQGETSPFPEDWDTVALRYMKLFRMLNAKEDKLSIIRAFYNLEQEEPEDALSSEARGKEPARQPIYPDPSSFGYFQREMGGDSDSDDEVFVTSTGGTLRASDLGGGLMFGRKYV